MNQGRTPLLSLVTLLLLAFPKSELSGLFTFDTLPELEHIDRHLFYNSLCINMNYYIFSLIYRFI